MEAGKLLVPNTQSCAHHAMKKGGDAPTSGARDLGHKRAGVESVQQPIDSGAPFGRILVKAQGGAGELVTQIAVCEAVQRVLAAHQRGTQLIGTPPVPDQEI